MKKIKALYRSRVKVLTDGAQRYRTACKLLSLDHDVYDLRLGNLMERIIQYVKDRTRDFDYIPCRKGGAKGSMPEWRLRPQRTSRGRRYQQWRQPRMLKFTEPLASPEAL